MLKAFDRAWQRYVDIRRIDRNPSYFCCHLGLNLFALSMILVGPLPDSPLKDSSQFVQDCFSYFLFFGTLICMMGCLVGSKYFFPKVHRRTGYRIGIIGNPTVVGAIFYYGATYVGQVHNWSSTLAAGFGPVLGAALLINAFFFWLEIRRINQNMHVIHRRHWDDD